jgi:hypothetical protein
VGTVRGVISTARQISKIIYRMFAGGVPFDETKMAGSLMRRPVIEIQAVA